VGTPVGGRARPWAAGLIAIGCLTSCASSDAPPHPTQPTRIPVESSGAGPASHGGCRNSGFALSLASGYHGWASPVEAAHQFASQSDPAGYSTIWAVGTRGESGVTLNSSSATLHAVRLPNGRWAIDSGQRCL